MAKLLITGGGGFIGTEMQSRVPNSRWVVRVNSSKIFDDSFFIKELNSDTEWLGAFEGIETVIHLAAMAHSNDKKSTCFERVNCDGTLKLAQEAALNGVKRFVFVSSIGVNGAATQDKPFDESSSPSPYNPYSISKYNAELGLKRISDESGLEVVIVRPTLVYGYNAPGSFGALRKLIQYLRILPFGLASNRRNFISVQNLADLLITCASHPRAAGHTFLACDSETVSTKEFTNAIAKGLSKRVIQLPVPVGLMRFIGSVTGTKSLIEQLFCNLEVDSSHTKEILGWTPPLTMEEAMKSLEKGMNNDSHN